MAPRDVESPLWRRWQANQTRKLQQQSVTLKSFVAQQVDRPRCSEGQLSAFRQLRRPGIDNASCECWQAASDVAVFVPRLRGKERSHSHIWAMVSGWGGLTRQLVVQIAAVTRTLTSQHATLSGDYNQLSSACQGVTYF